MAKEKFHIDGTIGEKSSYFSPWKIFGDAPMRGSEDYITIRVPTPTGSFRLESSATSTDTYSINYANATGSFWD